MANRGLPRSTAALTTRVTAAEAAAAAEATASVDVTGNQTVAGKKSWSDVAQFAGMTYHRAKILRKMATPAAKTVTAAITAAELVAGVITTTGATGPSLHQLPTGTLLTAEFPDIVADDSFDFFVINTGTGAATDATLTVNTDVTIVGNPTIGSLTDGTVLEGSAMFRARYTGGVTWVVYRLA